MEKVDLKPMGVKFSERQMKAVALISSVENLNKSIIIRRAVDEYLENHLDYYEKKSQSKKKLKTTGKKKKVAKKKTKLKKVA